MQYQETFRSIRAHKQVVSTTGKWLAADYGYAALIVGMFVLISVGGSIATSLGLV